MVHFKDLYIAALPRRRPVVSLPQGPAGSAAGVLLAHALVLRGAMPDHPGLRPTLTPPRRVIQTVRI